MNKNDIIIEVKGNAAAKLNKQAEAFTKTHAEQKAANAKHSANKSDMRDIVEKHIVGYANNETRRLVSNRATVTLAAQSLTNTEEIDIDGLLEDLQKIIDNTELGELVQKHTTRKHKLSAFRITSVEIK